MQFPPYLPQDDLLAQIVRLINDILSLKEPPSFMAMFYLLLLVEKRFGILRRFINIVGKAKAQQIPTPATELPKTNGNGNGHTNGNGKEPILLALISSEKQYLMSQIEQNQSKQRETNFQIHENMERLSLRVSYVERDVSTMQQAFRDEIAPMRTKLDAIMRYIESQTPPPPPPGKVQPLTPPADSAPDAGGKEAAA